MTRIAFLGLGAMGARMATKLLEAGHTVTVYNRSPGPAAALAERGAAVAETPRAAAEGAEVVATMLTNDAAAEAVWLDPETGALGGLAAGAVALEHSTVTPAWIARLDAEVRGRGATLLDAPVVGSRPQAEAGALVFLVGGPAARVDGLRSLFGAMGSATHHVGDVGAGAIVKLAVNALFATQVAAMSELLGFVTKAGLPLGPTAEVLTSLPVCSPAVKNTTGATLKGVFAPLFPIDLVEKDLDYLGRAAGAVQAAAPVVAAARGTFQAAQQAGHGGLNIHGVAKVFLPQDEGPA